MRDEARCSSRVAHLTQVGPGGQRGEVNDVRTRYVYEAILQVAALNRVDMPPKIREFIQQAHAMVRPRQLARYRDLTAAGPPHL